MSSIEFLKPFGNSGSNIVLNLGQSFRVGVNLSMQVHAVTAVSAFNNLSFHGALDGWVMDLTHTSPLPRIFLSISEENIVTSNIKTTENSVSFLNIKHGHLIAENSVAVIGPEFEVDVF